MIRPTCWVTVSGTTLATTPSRTAPFVLSPVSVTWGRSDVLEQADPATGRVQVFDPTFTWATLNGRNGDRLGAPVDVGWSYGTASEAILAAHVTGVELELATLRLPGLGTVDGALVTFQLASRLVDTTNRPPQSLPWSAQTAEARQVTIESSELPNRFPTSVLAHVYVQKFTGFVPIPAGQVTVNGTLHSVPAGDTTTFYDQLVSLYADQGAFLTYDPELKATRPAWRRYYRTQRSMAGLVRDSSGPMAGKGAYVATNGSPGWERDTSSAQGAAARSVFLDCRPVAEPSQGLLSRSIEQSVTDVEVAWSDSTGAKFLARRTVGRSYVSAATAQRTVKLSTQLVNSTEVGQLADLWVDRLLTEGNAWRMPPLVFDTRETPHREAGFDNIDQARELLCGWETGNLVFLAGTRLGQLGVRPVFGIMGATITHDAGDWVFALQLAPIATVQPQHAITPEEVDNGGTNTLRVYLDDADHDDALHPSVGCEDVRYCGTGLGVTVTGPDTGWDQTL